MQLIGLLKQFRRLTFELFDPLGLFRQFLDMTVQQTFRLCEKLGRALSGLTRRQPVEARAERVRPDITGIAQP